jgi:hypothetical protein
MRPIVSPVFVGFKSLSLSCYVLENFLFLFWVIWHLTDCELEGLNIFKRVITILSLLNAFSLFRLIECHKQSLSITLHCLYA